MWLPSYQLSDARPFGRKTRYYLVAAATAIYEVLQTGDTIDETCAGSLRRAPGNLAKFLIST